MSKLHAIMNDFHAAILEKNAAFFIPHIHPNGRISAEAQMNIYVEGYRLRLLETLQSDYPATMALLGQPAFDRLATAFIEATPPAHFSLDHYPYPFAGYLRTHANDAFAAGLASLESAIAELFLIEESAPLDASALSTLTPEAFGNMRLTPRTASRLLHMDFPVDAYLSQNRKGETAERPQAAPSYLYVVRHENEVKRHIVSQAEYLVLQQLAGGLPVGEALEAVAGQYPELVPGIAAHIQSWFAAWTAGGFFQSPPGQLLK